MCDSSIQKCVAAAHSSSLLYHFPSQNVLSVCYWMTILHLSLQRRNLWFLSINSLFVLFSARMKGSLCDDCGNWSSQGSRTPPTTMEAFTKSKPHSTSAPFSCFLCCEQALSMPSATCTSLRTPAPVPCSWLWQGLNLAPASTKW